MAKQKAKKWITTTNRFVAFLDIMGFKDFVSRNSHDKVYEMLKKLSRSKKIIDKLVPGNVSSNYYGKGIYTTSFSDSIILFSTDDTQDSFDLFSSSVAYILSEAMKDSIPMKGAIAHGIISVDKERQIYFGQPLIDAYLLQEDVNYYGVVAHNSIDHYFLTNKIEDYIRSMYANIKTPLKAGRIDHHNLNWFVNLRADNEDIRLRKRRFNRYMDKLRALTSGTPRKYIDNTVDVFNELYK